MKIILRKIESYENKKFSQTLKQHKDYTRVLLEITRKILSNDDSSKHSIFRLDTHVP